MLMLFCFVVQLKRALIKVSNGIEQGGDGGMGEGEEATGGRKEKEQK